jgi:hypothetical protein
MGFIFPEWGWVMGAILSVELNVWLLMLRRVALRRSDFIPSYLYQIINYLFYTTWIIVRIYVYPAIWVYFMWMAIDDYIRNGLAFHKEYIVVSLHTFLVFMNIKWSYDLFLPFFVNPSENYSNIKGASDGYKEKR